MSYKPFDNAPVANLFLDIMPAGLGTSEPVSKPKSVCGCKESFSNITDTSNQVNPTTIVENDNNGYDTLNMSPDLHALAFDELGPDEVAKPMDDNKTKPLNNSYNFITNIYVGSLSIIGLFALYRLIHKTR